ncbi:MAG TPA: hypothetical protein VF942_10625, partial [Acidimicrobiales bacterium]
MSVGDCALSSTAFGPGELIPRRHTGGGLEHATDQLAQRIRRSVSQLSSFLSIQRVHLHAEPAKFGKELL